MSPPPPLRLFSLVSRCRAPVCCPPIKARAKRAKSNERSRRRKLRIVMDRVVAQHCKQFSIYLFLKRFSQASRLISTKYVKNRIIMFCLELSYSEEYKMQPFSCQHREQHISKQDYEIQKFRRFIYISRLEPQRCSLYLVIYRTFLMYLYIWVFGIEVWLITFIVM
jgi:hypothetical protein